jgi:hypothetical protein
MREPQTIKTTPREVLWEGPTPLWKVISSKVSIHGKHVEEDNIMHAKKNTKRQIVHFVED